MKKSTTVTLVISGALLAGCDRYGGGAYDTSQTYTNNTYVAGQGYWHAPYHDWFPYPYNYFRPGFGYYHGGLYTAEPYESPMTFSSPFRGSGFSSWGGSSGSSYDGGGHSSISRGGFGGSARGGS